MKSNKPVWREWLESLIVIALLAIVIRSFIVAPFKIPSSSMVPTLEVGDYLFVLRYTYGFRIPFTDIQLLSKQAKRGDVAVFVYPDDKSKDYIKRIVGLPGDHIVYRENRLYVNGKEMPLVQEGERTYFMGDGSADVSGLYEEDLDGVKHAVLRKHFSIKDGEWTVPPNMYFAMGDNRNNSRDSRFWGFVPQSYMVGRAAIIWWSWDSVKGAPRWDRLGHLIE
ncbi:signal peptidase I [Mariprofundus ferrooxydans]|uniref:Signal peptidase I n=1 Tax=Mariprofundus ferrooxydans PV-1 TaxID=314345 RepID=Q0F3I2_9PROT|nr:signal peptidase I [Mariprofundus ferrooxydans]EAU55959.1 signal peptidase I [Mariprofundus ferrooxydans PV-1]KON48233.1 signal peptidase I [Mariprofundus ferrooxydans]